MIRAKKRKAPVVLIMDMMVTELHKSGATSQEPQVRSHKSGAFRLLEREQLDAIAGELKLSQSVLVNPSTALKVGRIAGAQYMMTGAVTLYYYSEKASGFALPILGISSKAKTAYVVLDIRIIDVETSEIVYAANQTGEATNKEKKSIGSSSKIVGGLLGLATRNASEILRRNRHQWNH